MMLCCAVRASSLCTLAPFVDLRVLWPWDTANTLAATLSDDECRLIIGHLARLFKRVLCSLPSLRCWAHLQCHRERPSQLAGIEEGANSTFPAVLSAASNCQHVHSLPTLKP